MCVPVSSICNVTLNVTSLKKIIAISMKLKNIPNLEI